MAEGKVHRPADEAALADLVAGAAATGRRLELRGGGSKRDIGAPTEADVADLSAFVGVVDYDPAELVLTARAATPLAEIEALLARNGQMLAFEPFDHGPVFGRRAGQASLGGVIAAGVAGSRRLSRGGARDHLLGFRAVSGRGEVLIGGGKVVKNVTGYDLPKLMAGSWGRLAALTEVTLKVLPRAPATLTLALAGLEPAEAVAAMARVLGAPAEVAAAAHLPQDGGLTLLRLEGFGPSVAARQRLLEGLFAPDIPLHPLAARDAATAWSGLRTLASLGDGPLWRILVPAGRSAELVTALERMGARWAMDWAGGLVWAATEADAPAPRVAVEACGGHAMLMRADEAVRRAVPALHSRPPGVAALEARVRRAFDPAGVFETGRFEIDRSGEAPRAD